MAIAYRAGNSGGNSVGTDVTVTKPSGTADNDILIAVLYREGGAWTLPGGWAFLINDVANFNNNAFVGVAWKRASGEGANYVFQLSSSFWRVVSVAAFSGATTSGNPFDASQTSNGVNLTAITALSITTGVDNEMAVELTANFSGDDPTTPTSLTYAAGQMLGGCGIFYKIKATAGGTGNDSPTRTGGTQGDWVAHHVALIPAAAGSSSVSPSVSPSASVSPSSSVSISVSPSISPSVSPSISPSESSLITGTACWGHVTGVTETNVRTFSTNWSGTGTTQGSGDSETMIVSDGEFMESEVVITGSETIQLLQNNYSAGDTITLRYRHGASEAACLAASWTDYTVPFVSSGYTQVRVEA